MAVYSSRPRKREPITCPERTNSCSRTKKPFRTKLPLRRRRSKWLKPLLLPPPQSLLPS
jgi:hypothetical protein